ncbi:hypothetical protein ACLOJK_029396 [Asimina triloba]
MLWADLLAVGRTLSDVSGRRLLRGRLLRQLLARLTVMALWGRMGKMEGGDGALAGQRRMDGSDGASCGREETVAGELGIVLPMGVDGAAAGSASGSGKAEERDGWTGVVRCAGIWTDGVVLAVDHGCWRWHMGWIGEDDGAPYWCSVLRRSNANCVPAMWPRMAEIAGCRIGVSPSLFPCTGRIATEWGCDADCCLLPMLADGLSSIEKGKMLLFDLKRTDLEAEVAMVVAVRCHDEEMPEECCHHQTCRSEVGRWSDLVVRCSNLPEEIGTTKTAVSYMGDTADGRYLAFERIGSDDQRSPEVGLAGNHLGKMEHHMRCSDSAL